MKLRFYAKAGHSVHWPGLKATGQAYAYVGRQLASSGASQPASKDAVEVDASSEEGRRFAKLCKRDGSLWPADKATANHCGVEFVELDYADTEWQPKATKSPRKGDE
jgi:hypothetical protein